VPTIPERLRQLNKYQRTALPHDLLEEAAAEIERLNAEVERLSVIRPEIIKAEAEHLGLVPKAAT
jgi:hypothetical protein